MPRYTQRNSSRNDDGLPFSVQDFISGGAPQGQRNHAFFAASAQLRDAGYSQSEAEGILVPAGISHGLTDHECRTSVNSAFSKPAREAPSHGGSPQAPKRRFRLKTNSKGETVQEKPKRKLNNSQPVPLPVPVFDGFIEVLKAAFQPGELVCIADYMQDKQTGEYIAPQSGVSLPREKWIERFEAKAGDMRKVWGCPKGMFMRINPMDGNGVSDVNVTSFRHVLVEWDKDNEGNLISKEEQLGMILASNLPVSAVIDSGNKSVHAWVRVDAETREEYDERVDEIYDLFDQHELDKQNRNPARLSRAAGFDREVDGSVKVQDLLLTDIGAESWAEWEHQQEVSLLGEPLRISGLMEYDTSNDPNNILGSRWLCKGGSLVINSQAGVGKSTLTTQLAIGWALGREELCFNIKPVKPLKSLILQAENDQGDLAEMVQGVRAGFNLTDEESKTLDDNILFHRITDKTGFEFLRIAEQLVSLHKPDILWIDPLLSFFGGDINKMDEVMAFCAEGLNNLSARTGVINILIHHMGKPPKDMKVWDAMTGSDMGYAGLGSSALTNWAREVLSFRRINPKAKLPTFQLVASKRRKRAGMIEPDTGEVAESIFIRHSGKGLTWRQIGQAEATREEEQEQGCGGGSYPEGNSRTMGGRTFTRGSNNVSGVITNENAPF
ncbi:MAG: AAA family ATPase [Myxococcales bacterium]|nr:AAA family ATPase [Myxococcales bacterium]